MKIRVKNYALIGVIIFLSICITATSCVIFRNHYLNESKYKKEKLTMQNLSANINRYTLVYNNEDPYGIYYATLLKNFFSEKGIELPMVSDTAEETTYEILLGNTNRYKTALNEQEYAVRLFDNKLLFEGGHAVMVEKAIKTFIANDKITEDFSFSGTDTSFVSTVRVNEYLGTRSDIGIIYNYVWGDEFDGNILDRTKFLTKSHGFAQGDKAVTTINGETVRTYTEYDFLENGPYGFVKDGKATFHTYTDENGITYNGRAFCTGDTMWWRYGYAELRAKVPLYPSAWPAWWTTANHDINYYPKTTADNGVVPPADWRYMPEIDIFEFWGDSGNPCANLHKWFRQDCFSNGTAGTNPNEYTVPTEKHAEAVKEEFIKARHYTPAVAYEPEKHTVIQTEAGQSGKQKNPPFCVDDGYHTFGFFWTPEKMIMSVDGKVYGHYDLTNEMFLDSLRKGNDDNGTEYIGMSMFREAPAHMIFDNWINTIGDFVGTKELPIPGSRDFVIEYVRLYQIDEYEFKGTKYKSGLWNYGLERLKNDK